MRVLISVLITLAFAIAMTSCGSKITTVNVRGKVTFNNKPIAGAEVRFGGPLGEDTTTTTIDGTYTLSAKGDKNDTLQLKVLWPGFEHDDIKFKTYQANDKPIDIQLRKIFTGTTVPANSNKSADNSNK